MLGGPGTKRFEVANNLAEYFQWELIQTGDLLRQEAKKNTPMGDKIKTALTNG